MFIKLFRLNPRVRHEYLPIQLLLVSRVSPIYLVDEFISWFQVFLKEMGMLANPRLYLFLFLVLIKE